MRNAIGQRPAIGPVTALQRSRNTDEFDLQFVAAGANHRIAMPADINEGKVRGEVAISFGHRSTHITVRCSARLARTPCMIEKLIAGCRLRAGEDS